MYMATFFTASVCWELEAKCTKQVFQVSSQAFSCANLKPAVWQVVSILTFLCNFISSPTAYLCSPVPFSNSLSLLPAPKLPQVSSEIVELFYLVFFVGQRKLHSAESGIQFNWRTAKVLNLVAFTFLVHIQGVGPCFSPLMNYVVTKISSWRLGLADWQKITKALFRQVL